jgi:hypothetical protein
MAIKNHNGVHDSAKLSSMEWAAIGTLIYELGNLRCIRQPSNEEQVVIDWMQTRISELELRKGL